MKGDRFYLINIGIAIHGSYVFVLSSIPQLNYQQVKYAYMPMTYQESSDENMFIGDYRASFLGYLRLFTIIQGTTAITLSNFKL